jgi:two-component system, chemotaxis family, CheB/CheR fusion protein
VNNFFRDREAFEALEAELPRVFRGKKASEQLRVWIVGCGTGEEAYSIAVLLAEQEAKLSVPAVIKVFATDSNESTIHSAREGFYPETIVADVSEERLRRFFTRDHRGYRINHAVRETMFFAVHNVLEDAPFSHLDLISCRNLLSCLDGTAQSRVLELFYFALRPNGMLFLGSSESTAKASRLFRTLNQKHRLYSRIATTQKSAPSLTGRFPLEEALESDTARARGDSDATSTSRSLAHSGACFDNKPPLSPDEWRFKLLEGTGSGSVVIDKDDNIVHVHGRAERYLHLGSGEGTLNLLRVVHPMLRIELRAAIFRARQTGNLVKLAGVPVEFGEVHQIDLYVRPAQDLAPNFLLVLFDEHPILLGEPAVIRPAEPLICQLGEELDQLKAQQRATVEEYETFLKELKSSNKDLQAQIMELRLANEELETGREELQSINEELSTVEQELNSKVDKLASANSDLQNLIASTDIATIFLDPDLCIRLYTPASIKLFNLIPADLGRPLSDLSHRFEDSFIVSDAKTVLERLTVVECEKRNRDGQWFIVRFLPYRTSEDSISGVVLTFVDITERKAAEDERTRLLAAERASRKDAEAANQAKDLLLAVLSHELRAPLNSVQLALELLQSKESLTEAGREALEMIQRNIAVETRLINDLLDVHRIMHGKLELKLIPLDLHVCVRQALEACMREFKRKELQLTVSLEAVRHFVLGDADRLQQVFGNLLQNATKFTSQGGSVSVNSYDSEGLHIVVEIADTGIGIEQEMLTKIFEPFQQGDPDLEHYGGLGLGLAISRSLIEDHGGELTAASGGRDQGSVFRVQLPTIPET